MLGCQTEVSIERLPPDQTTSKRYNFADETVSALRFLEFLNLTLATAWCALAVELRYGSGTLPPLEYRCFNPLLSNAEPLGAAVATPPAGTSSPSQMRRCSTIRFSPARFGAMTPCSMLPRRLKSGASVEQARQSKCDGVAAPHFGAEVVASTSAR